MGMFSRLKAACNLHFMFRVFLCVFCAGFAFYQCALSVEPARRIYVSPRGDDNNDGLTPQASCRTISKAAEIVEPGDLVLVSGGTYFENVNLKRAGASEKPIIFRAAPGETVIITRGEKPQNWRKVKDARFTYSVPYKHLPNDVWESRTVTRYVEVSDPVTLDRMPGAYSYDREKKALSVHPLRGLSPEDAGITVVRHSDYSLGRATGTIRPGLEEWYGRATHLWDAGIRLDAPYNRVEGFVVAYQPVGIAIKSDHCEARNNTVYGCREGIYIRSGDKGVVAGNECFLNYSHGIVVQTKQDVVVQNNSCWSNAPEGVFQGHTTGQTGLPHGMALYGGWLPGKISFIGNTVISDHPRRVWRIKNSGGRIVMTHNVLAGGPGKVHFPRGGGGADYSHNTVIGGVIQDRHSDGNLAITPEHAEKRKSVAKGTLYLKGGVQPDSGFADPGRHDYRLRKDSPHIGTGAFPEAAPLRYISPDGSDAADGRTPKTAWKTIAKAASSALPGETVYILPGVYRESVIISLQGEEDAPIEFKSYGQGCVVLEGDGEKDHGIVLKNAAHIAVHGLIMKGYRKSCVQIDGGNRIELVNNILDSSENGVSVANGSGVSFANNTVDRCGKGIDAQRSKELLFRNNLFVDSLEVPLSVDQATLQNVISERNVFSGEKAESRLKLWRDAVHESHPSLAVDVKVSSPDYLLPKNSPLAFLGLGHKPVGARPALEDREDVIVEDFRAASVLPDMAILTWYTPYDYADAELKWESAGGEEGSVSVGQDAFLKRTSLMARLTNLTSDRQYHVTLRVVGTDGRKGRSEVTFRTPRSVRRPSTLYVAPDGDDDNTGKERTRPLRTLSAASLAATPGDTISVAPGVYPETLTIWTSGITKDRRLIFRSEKRGEAVIDCAGLRPVGIRIRGVKHVTIDGFRIRGFRSYLQDAVSVSNTEDLLFTNNTFERGTACDLFYAADSREITVRSNLFDEGWIGVRTYRCDAITIDHNTFYHGGIGAVQLYDNADASYRIVNNIFYGVMHEQKDNAPVIISSPKEVVCDYNLYWQRPRNSNKPAKKSVFNIGRENKGATNARTIEEAIEKYGVEHHGKWAAPMFVNARKSDFRLKPGSPAIGMGENGSTVGKANHE